MPVRLICTLSKPPQWRGLGVYLDVELQSIDARPYRGKARLTEFLDDPRLREMFDALDLGTGDRLEILVKLHRPVVYRNPGVFDYRRHLERQGIYWTGTIRNPRLITVLDRGWRGIDRIKNWIEARLKEPFADDRLVRGLVMGMVIGQKHPHHTPYCATLFAIRGFPLVPLGANGEQNGGPAIVPAYPSG